MTLFALFLSAAFAGDDACRACCRAGGLPSCETTLAVYGDGSRLSREVGAWRVSGVWKIGCDGRGVFDASANALLDRPPLGGELLMGVVDPLQVHCFQQACGVPPGTCLSPPDEDGKFFLLECGTGLPADAEAMSRPPSADKYAAGTVVLVDGRPLVVASAAAASAPVSTGASFGASPAPSYSPPPSPPTAPAPEPAPAATTTRWSAPATTTSWSQPEAPALAAPVAPSPSASSPASTWSAPMASAPSAPVASAPIAVSPAPSAGPDPYATFATSLPKDPPEACPAPIEALRSEARKRVDLGDEKRIRRDATGALQEYRAALTMDVCNAYGWLGIGEVASEAARPDLAVRALRNTTRLLPGHYGAWALLGEAYEGLRQTQLAAEAYGEALALRPTLQDALDGWRRTARP